jgi:peroxiredoxin
VELLKLSHVWCIELSGVQFGWMFSRLLRRWFGGQSMTKVLAGNSAPAFTLADMNGNRCSLADALKQGPVLAAFFKISCPVCQFTFPFLERMYETYGGGKVTFWGVSQDDAQDTKEFCKEFDVTFPMLVDEDGYPASNQYGLTNVPSIFLIGPDGKAIVSSVGFSKADLEKISGEIARAAGKPSTSLFRPDEVVPDSKPG